MFVCGLPVKSVPAVNSKWKIIKVKMADITDI